MSKIRQRTQGLHPHIVISTKELQDPQIIAEWFETQKGCQTYIVSIEYGANGHPHLETFSTWDKEQRQDKIKEKVLKLYDITDYHGKLNTKVTFNHIDPDPMYGYGYAMKEKPKDMFTNLTGDYLQKALEYYNDHCEAVGRAKEESRKEHSKVQVNQIIDDFIDWLHEQHVHKLEDKYGGYGPGICPDNFQDKFKLFYSTYPKRVSYTEYAKIRLESVKEYVNMELERKRGTSS